MHRGWGVGSTLAKGEWRGEEVKKDKPVPEEPSANAKAQRRSSPPPGEAGGRSVRLGTESRRAEHGGLLQGPGTQGGLRLYPRSVGRKALRAVSWKVT